MPLMKNDNQEEYKYLLVSDSNEVSKKFDSKKIDIDTTFTSLAQENLFKTYLDIMNLYLTKDQYTSYLNSIDNQLTQCENFYKSIEDGEWSGKLKPVDGQVILIGVDEFLKAKEEDKNITTPLQYLMEHWDIT